MTSKVIAEILAKHGGFERDGERLTVGDEAETTLFASIGRESLIIDRVRHVDIDKDVLVVATRKERYVLACEDVRALRFSSSRKTGY
jgi:hypothetical protein